MTEVKFNNLGLQWESIKNEVEPQLTKLFETSAFINGPAVQEFEQDFAAYTGTNYAVGVSNGTDAIKVAVEALDLLGSTGIIVPANTFIATLLGAEQALPNAEFVLVDCDQYYQIDIDQLEDTLIKNRDRWNNCVLLPVHLYGHCANMNAIMGLADNYDCIVIEDSSQAHGTVCENGQRAGSIGAMGTFSLYPGKNLGAAGDAGIITTNDEELYERLKLLRNWGSNKKYYYDIKGYNNRLDTIQAIILKEKLKHLNVWNAHRNIAAEFYNQNIKNVQITTPPMAPYCTYHTYHVYCVLAEERDALLSHLNNNGVQTNIHYPVPIELTAPYEHLGAINARTRTYANNLVSLPIHPFITENELSHVCDVVNKF
jgi:dTDP-4-amino-4,6-dideoxygalactose transaminase